MPADPLPSLLAAGFTPEEARKACNVIADWLLIDGWVVETDVTEFMKAWRQLLVATLVDRLRAAGGGQ
jgi:hypothetical protein